MSFVSANVALVQVNDAIDRSDEAGLLQALMIPMLSLFDVQPQNSPWYLTQLCIAKDQKTQVMATSKIIMPIAPFTLHVFLAINLLLKRMLHLFQYHVMDGNVLLMPFACTANPEPSHWLSTHRIFALLF